MSRNSGRIDRRTVGSLAGLGSAAAIVGAGIAAMATGSVPAAAPQPDHSDVQTATLTQVTVPQPGTGGAGTADRSAGFVTAQSPVPASPPPSTAPTNTVPVIPGVTPGVTQSSASSANNPGGGAFDSQSTAAQAGIAPTPSGLPLSATTSNKDIFGFGNVGVSPAGKVTVGDDGSVTVTPGGVFAATTTGPFAGGGSFPFGFPVTFDPSGNLKFTAWDNFLSGVANLAAGKNTSNTTGFTDLQPANPNYDTNQLFGGTPTGDPFSKQTAANAVNFVNDAQANDIANAVNGLTVPSMQQLFPNGLPGDPTSGALLGVPGLGTAAAGNFSTFGAIAPASDSAVNTFAPRDPASPSAVGIPDNFATIDAMFPNAAPTNAPSGLPSFQQAYQAGLAAANGADAGAGTPATRGLVMTDPPSSAGETGQPDSTASPGLPAPAATATGTGLTTGDIAAVADPNAAMAAANASASMVTDPTQLPTIYQIAQYSGITPGGPSSS